MAKVMCFLLTAQIVDETYHPATTEIEIETRKAHYLRNYKRILYSTETAEIAIARQRIADELAKEEHRRQEQATPATATTGVDAVANVHADEIFTPNITKASGLVRITFAEKPADLLIYMNSQGSQSDGSIVSFADLKANSPLQKTITSHANRSAADGDSSEIAHVDYDIAYIDDTHIDIAIAKSGYTEQGNVFKDRTYKISKVIARYKSIVTILKTGTTNSYPANNGDEIKTGHVVEGKDVWLKKVVFTPSAAQVTLMTGVDTVYAIEGMLDIGHAKIPIEFFDGSQSSRWWVQSTGQLRMMTSGIVDLQPSTLFIRYTKK